MNAFAMNVLRSLGVAACAACCGCTTFLDDIHSQQARGRMETDSLKVTVSRLNERVAGLQQAQEQLFRELADLRQAVEKSGAADDARRGDVEARLKAIEQAREQDRQEIVGTLSKRMADVMNTQAQAQSQGVKGFEHVVKPGETLSEIAKAYGVTLNALVQANNLANPDSVRVGQKLFIPGTAGAR